MMNDEDLFFTSKRGDSTLPDFRKDKVLTINNELIENDFEKFETKNSKHSYKCYQCDLSYTSNYLLDIHKKEQHEPYSHGDKLKCLVEGCDRVFENEKYRYLHF